MDGHPLFGLVGQRDGLTRETSYGILIIHFSFC